MQICPEDLRNLYDFEKTLSTLTNRSIFASISLQDLKNYLHLKKSGVVPQQFKSCDHGGLQEDGTVVLSSSVSCCPPRPTKFMTLFQIYALFVQ